VTALLFRGSEGKKVKALELIGEWADVRDPEILARLNRPA